MLDFGVLAELYSLSSGQQQCDMQSAYLKGMDELKHAGFPFFLYGTVAWERKRKVWLSDKINSFLEEDDHQCINCFSTDTCSHSCCRPQALNFVARCGLQRKNLSPQHNTATVKGTKKEIKILMRTKTEYFE